MRARLDPALAGIVRTLRARAGGEAVIVDAASTPWASTTFEGARHRIALRLADADAARALADGLEGAEFDVPGHLVADIGQVRRAGAVLAFEALTVVDG